MIGWDIDSAWASGVSGFRFLASRSTVSWMQEETSLFGSPRGGSSFVFIDPGFSRFGSILSSNSALYLLVSATVLLNNCGPEYPPCFNITAASLAGKL